MENFETSFFLIVGEKLFTLCEELSKILQNPDTSASGSKKAANLLKDTLERFHSDECVLKKSLKTSLFWQNK